MHEAPSPASQELALVFDCPVPFDSFVRVLVPLQAADAGAAGDDSDPQQQLHARSCLLCERLHALDAGAGLFTAVPLSQTHVQVICHKTSVAKVYKLLLDGQRAHGGSMDPPKQAIKMGAMPFSQLKQGLAAAVLQQLRTAGWAPLRMSAFWQQLLLGDYLASEPGAVVSMPRIEMEVTLDAPKRLYLILWTDTVRYRRLDLGSFLQKEWPVQGLDVGAALQQSGSADAINQLLACAQQKPACCVLPSFRSAVVHAVALTAPAEGAFRENWFIATGQPLPASIDYFVEVGWADREDCFEADGLRDWIPACCLWSSTGVTMLPAHHPDTVPPLHTAQRLADALGASKFWGGGRGLKLHNDKQVGGSTPHCMAFSCAWSTALDSTRRISGVGGSGICNLSAVAQPPATSRAPHPARPVQAPRPAAAHTQKPPLPAPGSRPTFTPTFAKRTVAFAAATAPAKGAGARAAGSTKRPASVRQALPAAKRSAVPEAHAAPAAGAAAVAPAPAAAGATGGATSVDPSAAELSGIQADALQHLGGAQADTDAPRMAAPAAPVLKAVPSRPAFAGKKTPQQAALPAGGAANPGPGPAPCGDKPKAAPRARTKAADLDLADIRTKVLGALRSGTLGKLTMPELKCYLKAEAQPVKGKKDELVARLQEYLTKQP